MMKAKAAPLVALVVVALIGMGHLSAQPPRSGEDCVPYDPAALQLIDAGPIGWRINSGDDAMFMITDTKEDADAMMAVFKAHSALCYVGRNTKRYNRRDYVHAYWK
jgi:hypothetical protein